MFCYEGSIFIAGSAIQWLRDNLNFFKQSKETNVLYTKANDEENVIVVPAFTGLGAPHWDPNVRGSIFGLTRNTSKNDIIKATLDSISFQTNDLIESMEKDSKIKIKQMKVDGGMVNNNNFIQSLSDITQIKIIKPSNTETTSLGVAYLAALQAGILKNTNQINRLWKSKKMFSPKINKNKINKKIFVWKKMINLLISADLSNN
tara:strand:- start:114 stop:725 length:612 start_codon:yes stop_codon:yes gene_type:complete